MTQINLLPWREQRKLIQKNKFILLLVSFVGITIFIIVALHFYMSTMISQQNQNNDFLQAEITKEQNIIESLKKKKKEQENLTTKIQFIFSLRTMDYQAVEFLNELVHIIPESVFLTKISREGNDITLSGTASSNLQITLFMKNLSKSTIFDQPILTEMSDQENKTAGQEASVIEKRFQLKVKQKG